MTLFLLRSTCYTHGANKPDDWKDKYINRPLLFYDVLTYEKIYFDYNLGKLWCI